MSLPEIFIDSPVPGKVAGIALLAGNGGQISSSTTTFSISAALPEVAQGSGQIHVLIDAEKVIIPCQSGTSLTGVVRGVEGSEAAVHQDGATLYPILTASALGGESDPVAGTPGLRSLGTGAQQAASGAGLAAEISRAEAAEAGLAPLASPALTGSPTAPTAAANDDSTKLATTAYTDRAVSSPPVVSVTSPADGQLAGYNGTLGKWVPVNPSGSQRLASASNITGTVTSASAASGVGTAVAVSGTAISIATSNGLPVVLKWGAVFQQTVAGDGLWLVAPYETTITPTLLASVFMRLPNTTTSPACFASAYNEFDLGVVSSTRTFQLYFQLWSPAGSSPSGNLLNSNNDVSFLRAVAGS